MPLHPALALVLAFTPIPGETDRTLSFTGTLPLAGQTLRYEERRLLSPAGAVLVEGLRARPVSDGRHVCAADEGDPGRGRLQCWGPDLQPITLAQGGLPDRLAMGEGIVAWVASADGLPVLFVGDPAGRGSPRALTNQGLTRVPGQAPAGFVPPPLGDSLRIDGPLLRWQTMDGPRELRWR